MFLFYSSFLRQPETTDKLDTSATTSEPVCFTEENTDKNLWTNDEYKDEVTLVNSNSLSKNTVQDSHWFDEQKYF